MSINKIYFATSIAGGSSDSQTRKLIVSHLKNRGIAIPTEHFASDDPKLVENKFAEEARLKGRKINVYKRDVEWLSDSDAVVVEASMPSIGIGREIEMALNYLKIPVLILYSKGIFLTRMLTHDLNELLNIRDYETDEEIKSYLDEFLSKYNVSK